MDGWQREPAGFHPPGWRILCDVDTATRSGSPTTDPAAGERYLLLADISGYTGFMNDVELEHGADFSRGVPAAYAVLGALLDSVIVGLEPDFGVVKLEGDAVFAAAPAPALDGQGGRVLERLDAMYAAFIESRTAAIPSHDHVCTACPAVAHLDLKVVLHRGQSVRQTVGSGSDLLGPAVTVAHRLLKNTVRTAIGNRPYIFMTDAAANGLDLPEVGLAHREEYDDAGPIQGRVVELGQTSIMTMGTEVAMNFNNILIGSEDAEALAAYYTKLFGEPAMSEGGYTGWQIGQGFVSVGPHSEVHGKNTTPGRLLWNIETDDVQGDFDRMKAAGAIVVREPYGFEGMPETVQIATLADPDGNYFQLTTPYPG